MDVSGVFKAQPKSTSELFRVAGLGLYIPPYQRPYSWERKQVDRFVQDQMHGVVRIERHDDAITFIGTIIVIHDTSYSSIHPVVRQEVPPRVELVIDGQQRLTTLLLLMLHLREDLKRALKKLPKDLAEDERRWYETKAARLSASLLEATFLQQPGGDPKFLTYPRMIRAHSDVWSSREVSAIYESPIARLLFDYATFAQSPDDANKTYRGLQVPSGYEQDHREFFKALKRLKALTKALRESNASRLSDIADYEYCLSGPKVQKQLLDEAAPRSRECQGLVNLLAFGSYLLNRVCVTIVTVNEEDYAFDMFEALNTTGEPLTAFETLRPRVMEAEGLDRYESSASKPNVDRLDEYFESKSQKARQRTTARLVTYFALADRGEKLGRHLSEQRQFLRDSYQQLKDLDEKRAYVAHLRELVDFVDELWEPQDEATAWSHPGLMDEETALAMRALAEAGHDIAIAPLVQWYARWSVSNEKDKTTSAQELSTVIRGMAAFFAVWRLTRRGTERVDSLIRALMKDGVQEAGLASVAWELRGEAVPGSDKLLTALRSILTEKGGILDASSFAERLSPIGVYKESRPHTRLLLLLACNDTVPDPSAPGLLKEARSGSQPMLSRSRWLDAAATVEHIAPKNPRPADDWPPDIYRSGDAEHRLGNLTLLPLALNASISNASWNEKKMFYGLLASRSSEDVALLTQKLREQGIDIDEDKAEKLLQKGYQGQVAALSNVGSWSLGLIEKRSDRLARLAWRTLSRWLAWPESGQT